MATTYNSGLLSDFDRRYRQRRAATGRSMTSAEMTGLTEPLLGMEFQKSLAAEERARQQSNWDKQFGLQQQAQKDAAGAAKVSGLTDILGGGANLYFANKYLNLLGANAAPMAGVPPLTAPGALAAPATSAGAAGGGTGLMAGGAAGAPTTPVLATQTSFAPSMLAGESAAAAPTAAGATAGAGLAATAGAGLLLGAGAGYGLSKVLGANKDISQGLTLGGAGIGIGFMVGGPVGAVIGGLIGGGASLLDDIF